MLQKTVVDTRVTYLEVGASENDVINDVLLINKFVLFFYVLRIMSAEPPVKKVRQSFMQQFMSATPYAVSGN